MRGAALDKGAGFIPAAVSCVALAEAATHARLASDTYKRLNLGLVRFWSLCDD